MIKYFIENESGEWLREPGEIMGRCWTRDPLEAWGFLIKDMPAMSILKLGKQATNDQLIEILKMKEPGSNVTQWLQEEGCGVSWKITEHEFIEVPLNHNTIKEITGEISTLPSVLYDKSTGTYHTGEYTLKLTLGR